MRITSRRKFLGDLASAIALTAFPFKKTFAGFPNSLPHSPTSVKPSEYMNKFHKWYSHTFFNFEKHLSPLEKNYIQTCTQMMDQLSYKINDHFSYSLVTYSQRFSKNKVNSSRLAYGSIQHADRLQTPIRNILKNKGISTKDIQGMGQIAGLGWDFEENLLKVYSYYENLNKVQDADLKNLLKKASSIETYPFGLTSVSFKDKNLVEKKVYVALKEKLPAAVKDYPFREFIIHTNYMITDKRDMVPQVDLIKSDQLKNYLGSQWNHYQAQYEEFYKNIIPTTNPSAFIDTLAYQDSDHFTVYVP